MVDDLHSKARPLDIDAVLNNPSAHFNTPHDVLTRPGLPHAFKLKILLQWEQDARQLATADAEGMNGGEETMLARVRRAIRELDAEAADSSVHVTGADADKATTCGRLDGIASSVEDMLDKGVSTAQGAIRTQPVTAGLLALAVGFVVGRLSLSNASRSR